MKEELRELQDVDGLPEDPSTRPKREPLYAISDPEALAREVERMRKADDRAGEQEMMGAPD